MEGERLSLDVIPVVIDLRGMNVDRRVRGTQDSIQSAGVRIMGVVGMKITRRVARKVFNMMVVEDVVNQGACGGESVRPVSFNRSCVSVPRNEDRSLRGELGIKSHGVPPKLLVVFMGSMDIEDGNGMPLILD